MSDVVLLFIGPALWSWTDTDGGTGGHFDWTYSAQQDN